MFYFHVWPHKNALSRVMLLLLSLKLYEIAGIFCFLLCLQSLHILYYYYYLLNTVDVCCTVNIRFFFLLTEAFWIKL